jgi:hypothetical protein
VYALHVQSGVGVAAVYAWPGNQVWPSYAFMGDSNTGMFLNTTNVLGFSTNSLERMRIDTNGNVGIGTTAPTAKLELGMSNPLLKSKISGNSSPNYLSAAMAIAVQGKYAYVAAASDNRLTIIDVSNPSSPFTIGSVDSIWYPEGVTVAGRYAYLVNCNGELSIVDIADSKNPSLVGTQSGLGCATGVRVSGKYAYVASWGSSKFFVVDVSNPAAPKITGNLSTSNPVGLYVEGTFVYLAGANSLRVVNVSDPANPTLISNLTDNTYLNGANGVSVSGSYAYVAAWNGNYLTIVNVSNKNNITRVSSIGGAGAPNYLSNPDTAFVAGKYVYVHAYGDNSLTVIDVSNPANPTFAGNLVATTGSPPDQSADSLVVAGKYAYMVTSSDNSFVVADISGIDTPTMSAGSVQTGSLFVTENAVVSNSLDVRDGLNVGTAGILSNGPLAVSAASVPSYFAGNVGLGTTSPTQKLDVNGSGNFSGTDAKLWVNGSQVCTAANGLCPAGNVSGAGTSGTLAKFTGGSTIGNSIVSESGNTLTITGNISMPTSFWIGASGAVSNNTYSLALGNGAQATGDRSIAMGNGAQANAQYAIAAGPWAVANGSSSSAYGSGAQAIGASSSVYGVNALANSDASTAVGRNSVALQFASSAFGDIAQANGTAATAVGYNARATGDTSTAAGNAAQATGTSSSAFGDSAQATGDSSSAFGNGAQATWGGSAYGYNALATNTFSSAYGYNAQASGGSSSAFGNSTKANGSSGSAFGNNAQATSNYATAVGYLTAATVESSSAYGYGAWAGGWATSAFGAGAWAGGFDASAYGTNTHAGGTSSSAFGDGAHAIGHYSTALGVSANASYDNSVALGRSATTTAQNQLMVGASGVNLNTYIYGTLNSSGNVYENGSRVCTAANGLCASGSYQSSAAGWTNNSQNTTTTLNVGIGTTAPNYSLHVVSSSYPVARFSTTSTDSGIIIDSPGGSGEQFVLFRNNATTPNGFYAGMGDDAQFYIAYTNDQENFQTAEALTITQSRNVGIGTTAPNKTLHVNGNGTFGVPLIYINATLEATGTSNQFAWGLPGGATNGFISNQLITAGQTYYLALGANETERIRIAAGGDVGIGTASPSAALTVNGSGAAGSLLIQNSTASHLFVNGSSGDVGIGTTAPGGTLGIGMKNPVQRAKISGSGSPNYLGQPQALDVQGKYAYVAATSDNSLTIIDISNPSSPTTIGSLSGMAYPEGITVAGNYAYLASYNDAALKIVDISDPKNPTLVGTQSGIGAVVGVYVSGKYAYVASPGNNALYIVDVSNPASPSIKGTYSGNVNRVYVTGKYAYATSFGGNSLSIINVSDPANPTLVATLTDGTYLNNARSVTVSGSYAYVAASGNNYLTIVNVSNASNPTRVSSIGGSGAPNYLGGAETAFVSGKYVYVHALGDNSLTVIDVSNVSNPTFAGNLVATSGGIPDSSGLSLVVSGKYAYMVTPNDNSFVVADISGIDTPTISAGSTQTGRLYVGENADIGNNLYVKNGVNIGLGGILSNGPLSVSPTSAPSYFGGNVGIGTTNATQKLDVNGSGNFSGTVYATNFSSNSPLQLQTKGVTRIYINDTTGYVGIGTTNPTQMFDVNGSVNFSGTNAQLLVNGSQVCTAANGLCLDTYNTTAQMRAAINNSGYYNITANNSYLLNGQPSSYFWNMTGGIPDTNISSAATWNSKGSSNLTLAQVVANIGNYSAENATIPHNNSKGWNINITGTSAYQSSAAGWTNNSQNTTTTLNVGIGTTVPNSTLHVIGNEYITGTINGTTGIKGSGNGLICFNSTSVTIYSPGAGVTACP